MSSLKRKRGGEVPPTGDAGHAPWPLVGTRAFTTGKAVQVALAGGSSASLIAFHQQIYAPYSELPVPVTHPSIILLQHYVDLSPNCEEVFDAWVRGDKNRNSQLVEIAIRLLTLILQLITPLPFFRQTLSGLVKRVASVSEPYGALLNKAIQSLKRDEQQHALCLAAACVNADKPDVAALHSTSGRLAVRIWACLVEGGSVRAMGRMMHVRKRNKDGVAEYQKADPLDRPDIRHAILHLILPLVSLPSFHSTCRPLIKPLYAHLDTDPPITILRIFTALWNAVMMPSAGMARRASLALLDENAVEHLVGLLNRTDTEATTGKSVGGLAMGLLDAVTTQPGRGICFQDEGWYHRKEKDTDLLLRDDDDRHTRRDESRQSLHNRILANVVRKIGGRAVDDTGKTGEWMIRVFAACPELVAGFWPYFAQHIDPRLSARWIAAMSFIAQVISLPPPSQDTFHELAPGVVPTTAATLRPVSPKIDTIIESVLPSPLMLKHLQKGLGHPDALVRQVTALTLARAVDKLTAVDQLLKGLEQMAESQAGPSQNVWGRCRRELEIEARRRVPDVATIITLAQSSAALVRPPPGSGEDWEPEPALVARSDMLTEAALRLFKGYQVAFPSISREVKFDIGRLLVSGSTRKQEKKLKKEEKREGSTAGDTASAMSSVGTVGTAGMGGGFGADRGDTEGWQAVNQLHVVRLLLQAKEWQWWNKASGSQYTYFYHVLLLSLTSKHAYITQYTNDLLKGMLEPSLLFQHHPIEATDWLDALPVLHDKNIDTERRARLFTQQLYLLDFMDDCFRRAMQAPYKYIEDLTALWPDFTPSKARALPSPIIVTFVEQLRAKMLGEHISTEAAGVVLCYLRRVFNALSGKCGRVPLDALVKRIREALDEAKAKGQERKGLERIVSLIEYDIYISDHRDGEEKVKRRDLAPDEVELQLEDDEEFAHRSPYWLIVHPTYPNNFFDALYVHDEAKLKLLRKETSAYVETCIGFQPEDRLELICRLVLRRLKAILDIKIRISLVKRYSPEAQNMLFRSFWIVRSCLMKIRDPIKKRHLKHLVFETPHIEDLFVKYFDLLPDNVEFAMLELVNHLSIDDEDDTRIADIYCRRLADVLREKRGKNLEPPKRHPWALFGPWIRFLSSDQICSLLTYMIDSSLDTAGVFIRQFDSVLEDTFKRLTDPLVVIDKLDQLLDMDQYRSLERAFRHLDTVPSDKRASVSLSKHTIEQLCENAIEHGHAGPIERLLQYLPNVVDGFADHLKRSSENFPESTILSVASTMLELPSIDSMMPEVTRRAIDAAFLFVSSPEEALASGSDDDKPRRKGHKRHSAMQLDVVWMRAYGLLRAASNLESATTAFQTAATELSMQRYNSVFPMLCTHVLSTERPEMAQTMKRLLELGLVWATLKLSKPIENNLSLRGKLRDLEESIKKYQIDQAGQLDSLLVERFVTAAIQNTLAAPNYGLKLAATLLRTCEPKASFVRQSLGLIYASASFTSLDSSSANLQQVTELIAVLFTASPFAACQPNYLEPLLPLYSGTLNRSDQELLSVFHLFERFRHTSVLSLFRVWSPTGGVVKTRRRLADALLGIDVKKVFDTCCQFPLRRKLVTDGSNSAPIKEDSRPPEWDLYDPSFVLPLLAAVTQEQLSGLDWVEVLRSNVLGLAVCALASRDGPMRQLAAYCLDQVHQKVTASAFHEQAQVLLILERVRHAIPPTGTSDPAAGTTETAWTPPRLPTLTTLFIAHCLRSLANPSHFVYPLCMRFLLQRPKLDLYDVPMLFGMLYASGDQYKRERSWIVRLLKDGVKSSQEDWRILTRRRTTSLLMTIYDSSLDPTYRALILQAFLAFAAIPAASVGMVHGDQFLSWLDTQWISSEAHEQALESRNIKHKKGSEKAVYLAILEKIIINLVERERSRAVAAAIETEAGVTDPVHRYRLGWVVQAESVISLALDECERIPELEKIAQLAWRLSTLPAPADSAKALLLPLLATFKRLWQVKLDKKALHIQSAVPSELEARRAEAAEELDLELDETLFLIFDLTLQLPQEDLVGRVKLAVVEVAQLIRRSQDVLSRWTSHERRLAEWEAHQQMLVKQ